VQEATLKAKAQKIRDFPCKPAKNRAFRIAIFFDILMDFLTSLDLLGYTLGTVRDGRIELRFYYF
jgi:hypothetical protein